MPSMVGVAVLPAKCSVEPRHPPAEGAPPLALETGKAALLAASSVSIQPGKPVGLGEGRAALRIASSVRYPTAQAGGIREREGGVVVASSVRYPTGQAGGIREGIPPANLHHGGA